MKLEVELKFNIGDKVIIEKPHHGAYKPLEMIETEIRGYVIHVTGKSKKVYYTTTDSLYKNKRYVESELRKVEE